MLIIIVILALVTLTFVVMSFLVNRERKRNKERVRSPFTDKLLRPAGESLRVRLEAIQDELLETLLKYAYFGAIPLVFLVPGIVPAGSRWFVFCVGYLFLTPFLVINAKRVVKLLREKSNRSLGYAGERAVGEELNQLLGEGCFVYHDVVFDEGSQKSFNIDHVVVSPVGVYAIETKARRKPLEIAAKDCVVRFNGKTVSLPNGDDAHGLEQTARNARYLAKWLSSAVGDNVFVSGVLTFPGWFVKSTGKAEVSVLNPKMIRGLVLPGAYDKPLSKSLSTRIRHQMEQKCRNLEL